eukprot:Gb_38636 [translate_table: standard]
MMANNGLSLRDFTPVDLDDFYEWESDKKVIEYMTWEMFWSKEKVKDFLVKVVIPHSWLKEIILNGKAIGHVMLMYSLGIHRWDGYTISQKYWKMGFTPKDVMQAI